MFVYFVGSIFVSCVKMEIRISKRHLVAVVVLLECFHGILSRQCVKRDTCQCVFDDGSGAIDLTPLKQEGTPVFYDKPSSSDSFLYSYNPCGAFDDVTCANVAACQYDPANYLFYDIGVPESVTFNYDGLNVVAQYTSKDGARKSFVTLVCDPSATSPRLDVQGESTTTQYYFTLTSSVACVVSSPYSIPTSEGLSAGSVLLIIFFVLLAVYLIVGVAFNRVRHQSTGMDLLPNKSFWSAIPGLVRDGCAYSLAIICRKKTVYVSI